MKTLVGAFNRSRLITLLAATGIATLILFLLRPTVAEAAGVEEETVFIFNTFSFLIWGCWSCGWPPDSQCWKPAPFAQRTPP